MRNMQHSYALNAVRANLLVSVVDFDNIFMANR